MATLKSKKVKKVKNFIKNIGFKKGAAGELQKDFIERLYAVAPFEDIDRWSNDKMAAVGQSLFDFIKIFDKKDFQIRVYNPSKAVHGYDLNRTVIEINARNVPFIIDSVTSELARHQYRVNFITHPMMAVSRDKKKTLSAVSDYKTGVARDETESFIHIQLNRQVAPSSLKTLERNLNRVLKQVMSATSDWQKLLTHLSAVRDDLLQKKAAIISANDLTENGFKSNVEFLDYLIDNHFTFLGYRGYNMDKKGKTTVDKNKGMGVLKHPNSYLFDDDSAFKKGPVLPPEIKKFRQQSDPIAVRKSTQRSDVHRDVNMDVIFIKRYDDKGKTIGEHAFAGLFTSTVYAQSIFQAPFVSMKAQRVLKKAKFQPATHDYKSLVDILEKYPRDEMLQACVKTIHETAMSVLELKERQRVAVYFRTDDFERFVTVQVYIPRDRYGTEMRLKIKELLEDQMDGDANDFYTSISDSPLARVIFIVRANGKKIKNFDAKKIEKEVAEIARSWNDHLRAALIEKYDTDKGQEIYKRYKHSFSNGYRVETPTKSAIADIEKIEDLFANGDTVVELYKKKANDQLALKLYHKEKPVVLSDIVPFLENLGLKVITEDPHEVHVGSKDEEKQTIWMHDFLLECRGACIADIDAVRDYFEDAFLKSWQGVYANDRLNKLVLLAGMSAADVNIARCYARYLRQAVPTFSRAFIKDTLCRYPTITEKLITIFKVRHDISFKGKRDAEAKKIIRSLDKDFTQVNSLSEDQILRYLTSAVQNTLRTNLYQDRTGRLSEHSMSIKLASEKLEFLPLPRPYREIFVYANDIEGVHLRGGAIARGGLRWSDRFEDYRTEVLGLMKAQMVKNAVIVPVGSKGGFVCKNDMTGKDRNAFFEEGKRCYRIFISSLLDITDNLKNGQVIAPQDTIRHDGDDPYFVVAADKGTATFSDIANSISNDYGFWLGDAFASGGSAGYDHKAMGITAKGAWECVKRHFREIGKDIQKQEFTVVGVGDMSGDVFGNGMLLSEHIKLIGAFNHMHIFCDPNPDAAASFKERERMFALPRSAWTDYNKKILSKGARIFDRSSKSLDLTPEIQNAFGLKKKSVTPDELMKAMLKSKTDLMWFGGIGTYIKSSDEGHADVGDRANDTIRINGDELNALVMGEGANLGCTQKGRIEYAQNGGRLNADFVDNSGGVDCSDHEVNIKILFADIIAKTSLTMKKRNNLLEKMEDQVGSLVMRNNYQQTQAISLSELKAPLYLETHEAVMRDLERKGLLNRTVEYLPDDEEIANRKVMKKGLTRPELAILTSYSKINVFNQLLESPLLNDPALHKSWLMAYFPEEIKNKYEEDVKKHQLSKHIIATELAGSLVNRMGFAFVKMKMDKTGASLSDVAKAYILVKDICGLGQYWSMIEALDNKVDARVQYELLIDVTRLTDRIINWLLIGGVSEKIDVLIKRYKGDFDHIKNDLQGFVTGEMKRTIEKRKARLIKSGIDENDAKTLALLPALGSSFEIIKTANTMKKPVLETAQIFFAVGNRFSFDWLRGIAKSLKSDDYWRANAINGIVDDLNGVQAQIARKVIKKSSSKKETLSDKEIISAWADDYKGLIMQVDEHLSMMKREGSNVSYAMLSIADQKLRTLGDL